MSGQKYMQVLLLLLVHCITLILIFFNTSGLLFRLELGLFLFMLLVSLIYLFGMFFEEGWAWVLIMIFYGVNIINLIFLKTKVPDNWTLFGILIVVDLIGFFMAIANIGKDEDELDIEPYDPEKKEKQEAPEVIVYHHDDAPAKVERSAVKRSRPKAKAAQKSRKNKPEIIKDLKDKKIDKRKKEYII